MINFDPDSIFESAEDVYSYVIARDKGICQITGKPFQQIHHIIPRSQGGKNIANNLICLTADAHMLVHKDTKKWETKLFCIVTNNNSRFQKEIKL